MGAEAMEAMGAEAMDKTAGRYRSCRSGRGCPAISEMDAVDDPDVLMLVGKVLRWLGDPGRRVGLLQE